MRPTWVASRRADLTQEKSILGTLLLNFTALSSDGLALENVALAGACSCRPKIPQVRRRFPLVKIFP